MSGAPRNDEARWQAGNVAQHKTLSPQSSVIDRLLSWLDRHAAQIAFLLVYAAALTLLALLAFIWLASL